MNRFSVPDNIIVNAEKLRLSSARDKELQRYIIEISKSIMSEIIEAYRIGKYRISISIPTTFVVPHTTNTDAQRVIWSTLIESFEQKGFDVKISHTENKCILYISLLQVNDELLIDTQNKTIASHSV